MEKKTITLDQIADSIKDIVAEEREAFARIDIVIGVSRGGLVPAVLLAAAIGRPLAAAYINKKDEIFFDRADWIKGKNIVVVDDVIRSGKTLWLLKNFLEKNTVPAAMSFFALFKVGSLRNDAYDIPAYGKEIGGDVIFPWDHDRK